MGKKQLAEGASAAHQWAEEVAVGGGGCITFSRNGRGKEQGDFTPLLTLPPVPSGIIFWLQPWPYPTTSLVSNNRQRKALPACYGNGITKSSFEDRIVFGNFFSDRMCRTYLSFCHLYCHSLTILWGTIGYSGGQPLIPLEGANENSGQSLSVSFLYLSVSVLLQHDFMQSLQVF